VVSTLLSILLGVVVVLLITALTGYFVAQEFGCMASTGHGCGPGPAPGTSGPGERWTSPDARRSCCPGHSSGPASENPGTDNPPAGARTVEDRVLRASLLAGSDMLDDLREQLMTVTGIITAIVVGLVIGALGRLVVPGKQNIPIWLTIVVGIVAALIGTAIARALGVANTRGFDWIELIVQVILAAIGVTIAANAYARRSIRR
jgi:uncharacterized membrane protein YeaQ/YmgE (transglycosylase-associated protein family)